MNTKKEKETAQGNKFGFKSLDDVFSYSKKLRYNTKNKDAYEIEIKRMNVVDLQAHAISLGLKPSRNRNMLEKNLLSLFRKNNGDKFGLVDVTPKGKKLEQVKQILSKGA